VLGHVVSLLSSRSWRSTCDRGSSRGKEQRRVAQLCELVGRFCEFREEPRDQSHGDPEPFVEWNPVRDSEAQHKLCVKLHMGIRARLSYTDDAQFRSDFQGDEPRSRYSGIRGRNTVAHLKDLVASCARDDPDRLNRTVLVRFAQRVEDEQRVRLGALAPVIRLYATNACDIGRPRADQLPTDLAVELCSVTVDGERDAASFVLGSGGSPASRLDRGGQFPMPSVPVHFASWRPRRRA
jgi:hypothetical protein